MGKKNQTNKQIQKSITAPRQKQYIVRCSSGQVEQNNLIQGNEKMKLRSLLTTFSFFNIPFIQIQLKAVRRRKIKSKPRLYKKPQCNLSHSLFCLWVFALAYNRKVYLCCTSVQNQVRCELKVLSPPGHFCCLNKAQIHFLLQELEPMSWYTHWYSWMVAGITGLRKFQIKLICLVHVWRG